MRERAGGGGGGGERERERERERDCGGGGGKGHASKINKLTETYLGKMKGDLGLGLHTSDPKSQGDGLCDTLTR